MKCSYEDCEKKATWKIKATNIGNKGGYVNPVRFLACDTHYNLYNPEHKRELIKPLSEMIVDTGQKEWFSLFPEMLESDSIIALTAFRFKRIIR